MPRPIVKINGSLRTYPVMKESCRGRVFR